MYEMTVTPGFLCCLSAVYFSPLFIVYCCFYFLLPLFLVFFTSLDPLVSTLTKCIFHTASSIWYPLPSLSLPLMLWPLLPLFCAGILSTFRAGSSVVPRPRPAVAEREQDGEDGSVGAVCYARGSRVCCGSDSDGLGTWGVTAAVLMWRRRHETTQTQQLFRWSMMITKLTPTDKDKSLSCWQEASQRSVLGAKKVVATQPQSTTKQPQGVCMGFCASYIS